MNFYDVMQDLTEKTLATERKYTGKIISVGRFHAAGRRDAAAKY